MNNIRRIRARLKLSQFDFGVIAGVTQATVSRWETGHLSPSLDELKRIQSGAKERRVTIKPDEFFAPIAQPSEQRRAG